VSVRFHFDWVDAAPSPDCAAQHTMAALRIEVGGTTVTSVRDRRDQVSRDHIVVPLFNLAEWLVSNWWHLWYEYEIDNNTVRHMKQKPGFEHRHDLALAGNGFVLPRLMITVRSSKRMHLKATKWAPRHTPIEFVKEAKSFVSHADLEMEFRTVVEKVLERLRGTHNEGSASDSLHEAWNAIKTLDPEEVEFSAAAARLGIDPFDVDARLADSITAFWQHTAPSIREEALASCDESNLSRVGEWLDEAIVKLERTGKRNDWADIRETAVTRVPVAEPWRRGHELAKSVRHHLGIGDSRFEFQPDGPLAVHHSTTVIPGNCSIQGLVAAGAPACITAKKNETSKRFLLARALGDYIGQSEPGPGILTSLYTDRQAQSRAFAAELLAPADSLRARLGDEPVEHDTIDEISREFGVSSQVIGHQLENHGPARPGHQGRSLR